MSQVRNAILEHLQAGGTLTKISAVEPPFSTTNLGDKVLLLRRQGWPIEKRWAKTFAGRRYAIYFLPTQAKAA